MSRILEEVTEGKGGHAKLSRTMRMNQGSNWLLALVLNSYAKDAAGVELNELDTILRSAFDTHGLGEQLRSSPVLRLYLALLESSRRPGICGADHRAQRTLGVLVSLSAASDSVSSKRKPPDW